MLPKKALEVLKWQHYPSSLSRSQITHHISANNFHIWFLRLIKRLPPVWGAFEALWGHIIEAKCVGSSLCLGCLFERTEQELRIHLFGTQSTSIIERWDWLIYTHRSLFQSSLFHHLASHVSSYISALLFSLSLLRLSSFTLTWSW